MTLKTRKPTGRAGWPKILVEGGDKAGKSWSLAKLSASPKVGRTIVLALGEDETRWDEYGLISGARFELALHDGTWASIMDAVVGAKEEAAKARDAGELPFVFGFDTMTAEWEGQKDWASLRARSSRKNRALLEQDPDAVIDVTANYWNDARGRHRALMRHLLTFPGIVVLIARGSEVTLFQNGQPVLGRTTWSVESEKNLPFDVSAHIRLSRESRPLLVSASGVHCQIRPGIDPPMRLPDDWSLESVIFGTLKLDAANAEVRDFVEFKQDLTPEQVRDEALLPATDFKRIRELYAYTNANFPGVTMTSGTGDEETLLKILKRAGDERLAADGKGTQARKPEAQEAAAAQEPARQAADAEASPRKDVTAWAAALIDGIKSAVDGERADGEVDQERDAGRLSEETAAGLHRAIAAKVADVISARADVTDKAAA